MNAANHEVIMNFYLADCAFYLDICLYCRRLHIPKVDFHVLTSTDYDVHI